MPFHTAVVNSVPQDRLGMASASIATARQTGLAIGIALSSAVFSERLSNYNESPVKSLIIENLDPEFILIAARDTILLSTIVCALTLIVFIFWKKGSAVIQA